MRNPWWCSRPYLDGGQRRENAQALLLEHLGWDEPREEAFGADVRIVLASAEFSKELTTSVLWLNEKGLDIRCVRLKPYRLGDQLLLDVQQVIPLAEAADYQVKVREKAEEQRLASKSKNDLTRYDLTVAGKTYREQWKRAMVYHVVRAAIERGVSPERLAELLPRGASRFVSVAGTCSDTGEFLSKLAQVRAARGGSHDPRRFFTADDELIHFGDCTYALSNQWGGERVFTALGAIAEAHPELRIKWRQAGLAEASSDAVLPS